MAGRAFLFLVVPANLVASAKQKSSAPLPTQDESIPAKLASRSELTDKPTVHNLLELGKCVRFLCLCRSLLIGVKHEIRCLS